LHGGHHHHLWIYAEHLQQAPIQRYASQHATEYAFAERCADRAQAMNQPRHKFSIGRERSCDIPVADDSVSARHAELTFLGDGKLLLTDCYRQHQRHAAAAGKRARAAAAPGVDLADGSHQTW
jgi:hypothetical protein